jgi:hypothetical protein
MRAACNCCIHVLFRPGPKVPQLLTGGRNDGACAHVYGSRTSANLPSDGGPSGYMVDDFGHCPQLTELQSGFLQRKRLQSFTDGHLSSHDLFSGFDRMVTFH